MCPKTRRRLRTPLSVWFLYWQMRSVKDIKSISARPHPLCQRHKGNCRFDLVWFISRSSTGNGYLSDQFSHVGKQLKQFGTTISNTALNQIWTRGNANTDSVRPVWSVLITSKTSCSVFHTPSPDQIISPRNYRSQMSTHKTSLKACLDQSPVCESVWLGTSSTHWCLTSIRSHNAQLNGTRENCPTGCAPRYRNMMSLVN